MSVEPNLSYLLKATSSVVVIEDGVSTKLSVKDKNIVVEEFIHLISKGYEMPAFGVALDEETQKQKQQGLFVEFCFDDVMEHNGMPFCKLLVEINEDYSGFNIIRYNDGGYNGRCFYINLQDDTMKDFYNTVKNIHSCQEE